LATGINTPVANLPPVITTPMVNANRRKDVATGGQFAAGDNDTHRKFANISREFSKKWKSV
jgi:hypothetical protein